ncbi:MAG: hypothetical protein MJY59_00430 [Bacteroidaceae bacterium]|nr:hypothetical protein [Bacteroidaceae bacterium]
MRKFLSALALLLPFVAIAAQTNHWTPKGNQDYSAETAVFIRVYVGGRVIGNGSQQTLELGAFINGECRAMKTSKEANTQNVITMRVAGNPETELNQTVSFKAFYNGIEYDFAKTIKFIGDGNHEVIPIDLYLDEVKGIVVKDNPIKVEQKPSAFPYTVDIADYVTFQYNGTKGESSVAGRFAYEVSQQAATSSDNIETTGSEVRIKTGKDGDAYTLDVKASYYLPGATESEKSLSGTATIQVIVVTVGVTSITCDIESIDKFFAYDNLKDYLSSHLTILPADADNKDFKLVCAVNGVTTDMTVPTTGGEYTVMIAPVNPDQSFTSDKYPKVNVKVYVRPLSISTQTKSISLKVGEKPQELIKGKLSFAWPEHKDPGAWAANEVSYTYDPEEAVSPEGLAVKKGTAKATVTLTDGVTVMPGSEPGDASVEIDLDITSALKITWRQVTTDFLKTGSVSESVLASITVDNPANEPFDIGDVSVKFPERYTGKPYAELSEVKAPADASSKDYSMMITPRFAGKGIPFDLVYDGDVLPMASVDGAIASPFVNIKVQQELRQGWNWVSVNAGEREGIALERAMKTDDLIEIRSQQQLTFNDKGGLGLFGDLTILKPTDGMYKVHTSQPSAITLGDVSVFDLNEAYAVARKGYNWINNPYEFDITADRLADFLNGVTPEDGDMIITKDNFATYKASDGTWVAGLEFALREGQGCVYYTNQELVTWAFNKDLMPADPGNGVKSRQTNARKEVFSYNPHAFADNMALIAKVEGLQNASHYSIGVFVGDECRGRGEFVDGDIAFINASGKAGERLTFVLHDYESGESYEMNEVLNYTTRKGSLREPVMLSAPYVTGIQTQPGLKSEEPGMRTYNTSGQIVNSSYNGIVIKNGKKYLSK